MVSGWMSLQDHMIEIKIAYTADDESFVGTSPIAYTSWLCQVLSMKRSTHYVQN